MTTPQLTAEDYERARERAERCAGTLRCSIQELHTSRVLLDALARLEAAERKVEAWGPIVAAAIEAARTSAPLAQLTMICLAVNKLPEDMKP